MKKTRLLEIVREEIAFALREGEAEDKAAQMAALAQQAGVLSDKIKDANDAVAVFASGSKFEQVNGDKREHKQIVDFTVRYDADTDVKHRVSWNNRYFNILNM